MKSFLKSLLLDKIIGGPFAGMRYLGPVKTSTPLPKVLGTYELELQPLLARIIPKLVNRLVVAGAAEGYYAVGLLRNIPKLKAVAFESHDYSREQLQRMAELNGVADRIDIRGLCTVESLKQVMQDKVTGLLFMDVEGAEDVLLDPAQIHELQVCPILVEVHEGAVAGITSKIIKRFSGTHTLEHIKARKRQPADISQPFYRFLARLPGYFRRSVLWERGPNTNWLYLSPQEIG